MTEGENWLLNISDTETTVGCYGRRHLMYRDIKWCYVFYDVHAPICRQSPKLGDASNSGLDGRSWHVLRYESLADGVEPVLFLNLLLNLAAVIIKVSQERHMQPFLSIIPYKDSGSRRRSRLAPSGTPSLV